MIKKYIQERIEDVEDSELNQAYIEAEAELLIMRSWGLLTPLSYVLDMICWSIENQRSIKIAC